MPTVALTSGASQVRARSPIGRLMPLWCLATAMVMATSTRGVSQQRSFTLADGGIGVFVDGALDHTMIARRTVDGALRLECIQGDRHVAADLLRSGAVLRPGGELPPTAEPSNEQRAARAAVAAGIRFDPDAATGVDDDGRVLLYMPKPLEIGSSGSHFDRTASPDLLMEPSISSSLRFDDVDVTDEALRDMGWRPGRFRSELRFTDADGTGFNDPALGSARRTAMQFMLGVWERLLGSATPLVVEAGFAELSCSATDGAVLGEAGPQFVFVDFAGGDPGVVYPGPTAESIAGDDLSSSTAADIVITFNSAVDGACLGPGTSWYYGLDDNAAPAQTSFLPVALHEMAHGLGFVGLTDLDTGAFFLSRPDILATMTFDNQRNKTWDALSPAARRKSAVRDGEVAFTGNKTLRGARPLLRGATVIQIAAPANLAGEHVVGRAFFGPMLDEVGVANDLALVDDGTSTPARACAPLVNGAEIAGKIAVIDRGECRFDAKVQAAQDAGAVGVVVVNNVGGPAIDMAGEDGLIAIPAVMVDKKLGRKIKRRLKK